MSSIIFDLIAGDLIMTGVRIFLLAGSLDKRFNIANNQFRLCCDILTSGRDRNLAIRPVHKLRIQQTLQILEGSYDRRHIRRQNGRRIFLARRVYADLFLFTRAPLRSTGRLVQSAWSGRYRVYLCE